MKILNMKQIFTMLCCAMISFISYAQAPILIDKKQHQYVFAIYNFDNSQIFRLDTSSGELYVLKFKNNPEKSYYVKIQDSPNIPQEERYYGRFAILQHPQNYYIFVVDYRTGDTWQLSKNSLVKINVPD